MATVSMCALHVLSGTGNRVGEEVGANVRSGGHERKRFI